MPGCLVVIETMRDAPRLLILAGDAGSGKLTVFATGPSVAAELGSRYPAVKTKDDYSLSDEDWRKGMDGNSRLANSDISGSGNIKDMLVHRQLSLWWLIEQPLYVSRFAAPSVKEKIETLIMLEKVLADETPAAGSFLPTMVRRWRWLRKPYAPRRAYRRVS